MNERQRRRVFVSHSHEDNGFVEQLATDIEDAGLECWLDLWELNVGDSLTKRIESGITTADWLLVVLSRSSVQSRWIEHELSMAFIRELTQRTVFVLPVVIDECEIPLGLRDKLYADFRNSYPEGLHGVISRLREMPSTESRTLRRLARYCVEVDEYLPVFATLLEAAVDAGLPFLQALEVIAAELPEPIAGEIVRLHSELRDKPLESTELEVFRNLRRRVPTKRMLMFVSAVCVGWRSGYLDVVLKSLDLRAVESGRVLWQEDAAPATPT